MLKNINNSTLQSIALHVNRKTAFFYNNINKCSASVKSTTLNLMR